MADASYFDSGARILRAEFQGVELSRDRNNPTLLQDGHVITIIGNDVCAGFYGNDDVRVTYTFSDHVFPGDYFHFDENGRITMTFPEPNKHPVGDTVFVVHWDTLFVAERTATGEIFYFRSIPGSESPSYFVYVLKYGENEVITPPPALNIAREATTIAAGSYHSMVIKTDGSLWAWGDYAHGKLGIDYASSFHLNPVQVKTACDWAAISASSDHTIALKEDGSLWAWGYNEHGQLGDGTNIARNVPVRIGEGNDWKFITTGYTYSLAIKIDGSLWAWGANADGQLGDGTTTNRFVPTRVGAEYNWVSVSASSHTVAIDTDGSLWAWGNNQFGNLGDGTTIDRHTPVRIGSDNWVAVAVGVSHTVAVKQDNSLWAWGNNGNAQLGQGFSSPSHQSTPIRVGSDNNWDSVSAGLLHIVALKTDGSLWAWGSNQFGQLGNGTTIQYNAPTRIGSDNWAAVSAGWFYTAAVNKDGSLWVWGRNNNGQLGDGTIQDRHSPVKIMDGVKLPGTMPTTPIPPSNGASTGASDWAIAEIKEAISLGIVPDELLKNYQANITRAEFCKTVVSMLMAKSGTANNEERFINAFKIDLSESHFTDTSDRYITIAYVLLIVNGTGNNRFSPDSPITRQEAATMLSRAAAVFEFTTSSNDPIAFTDRESIAIWARREVDFVSANGIMGGIGNNTFSPHDHYSREQAIVTMLRLFRAFPREFYPI